MHLTSEQRKTQGVDGKGAGGDRESAYEYGQEDGKKVWGVSYEREAGT